MRAALLLLALPLLACAPARSDSPDGDDDDAAGPSDETAWIVQTDRYADGSESVSHRFYVSDGAGDCAGWQVAMPGIRAAGDESQRENEVLAAQLEEGTITEEQYQTLLCENVRGLYSAMAELTEELLEPDGTLIDTTVSGFGPSGEPLDGTYVPGGESSWEGSVARFITNPFRAMVEVIDCSDPEWQTALEGPAYTDALDSGTVQSGQLTVERTAEDRYHLRSEDGVVYWEGTDGEPGQTEPLSIDGEFPRCDVLIENDDGANARDDGRLGPAR